MTNFLEILILIIGCLFFGVAGNFIVKLSHKIKKVVILENVILSFGILSFVMTALLFAALMIKFVEIVF